MCAQCIEINFFASFSWEFYPRYFMQNLKGDPPESLVVWSNLMFFSKFFILLWPNRYNITVKRNLGHAQINISLNYLSFCNVFCQFFFNLKFLYTWLFAIPRQLILNFFKSFKFEFEITCFLPLLEIFCCLCILRFYNFFGMALMFDLKLFWIILNWLIILSQVYLC